ncbi:THO complex subunit 7 homolog [Corticium candelabrum]|uniref:THO complex subunit 7 homolog n=1 Tax=Corticium candelabrum TaxID=121492 RepID=UPI002E25C773|nr:THO complex subunit 7 homolog [Corticium candelabrum]
MAAAADDEKVIRTRLLVDGDGSGDDRRLTTLLRNFIKWCNSDAPEEERHAQYQRLLVTLSQCEFAMGKTEMVCEMNQRETHRYEQMHSDIERSIQEAQIKIKASQKELRDAKNIRKHRQEYDALASIIQQHPDRQESAKQMVALETELSELKEQQEMLQTKLETRRKQFHVLVHSIHELQKLLEDEETETPMERKVSLPMEQDTT